MQYAIATRLELQGEGNSGRDQVPYLRWVGNNVVILIVHGDEMNKLSVCSASRREHSPHERLCRLKGIHKWQNNVNEEPQKTRP